MDRIKTKQGQGVARFGLHPIYIASLPKQIQIFTKSNHLDQHRIPIWWASNSTHSVSYVENYFQFIFLFLLRMSLKIIFIFLNYFLDIEKGIL